MVTHLTNVGPQDATTNDFANLIINALKRLARNEVQGTLVSLPSSVDPALV